MFKLLSAALAIGLSALAASAQVLTPGGAVVGGVALTPDGLLQVRQTAAIIRKPGDPSFTAISLPRALAQLKSAADAGKPAPDEIKYLHGLTRITHIFIYPEQHDLILAGPAEPIKADNPVEPVGALTGRPLVQLEDVIVALRCVEKGGLGPDGAGRRDFFGCSLDPPPGSAQLWNDTLTKYAQGPRPRLMTEARKAVESMGPQVVKLFGVPEDSRIALSMVAADYRLKRLSMGMDPLPAGIGNALGKDPSPVRLWFEPSYEPLLVSADGNSYELRGPRLKLVCGNAVFDPRVPTESQKRYAAAFSDKINDVAARWEAIADLQNVADCFMVAALVAHDQLAQRAGVDLAWALAPDQCRVQSLPVPRTATTLLYLNNNVIVQGGVALATRAFTDTQRTPDDKADLAAVRVRPADGWFLAKPTAKSK